MGTDSLSSASSHSCPSSQMSLRAEGQARSPERVAPRLEKGGLRRRFSRFFSRSEISLKELQRQENAEKQPRPAAAKDSQVGCDKGKRRKKNSVQRTFGRRRQEEQQHQENSEWANHATESPNPSRPQKSSPEAHALSYSEPNLQRNGLLRRFGSLAWRKRRSSHHDLLESSGNPASGPWPLGRLQRPAVGSDLDMRSRSDSVPTGNESGKRESPVPPSQPSETDSVGPSPVPSISFDSVFCWGDGSSWEGSFSISNSSLYCPASPEMIEETTKLPSVQEETSMGPLSEWDGSVFKGYSETACPTVTGELENLSFSSGLGESISEPISGAEGPKAAAAGRHVEQAPEVADAASAVETSLSENASQIHYVVMITLTKGEGEDGDTGADCGEEERPCHPLEEGALSLGVAELEKTEEQRHQKPARPAPQLSAHKECQNCTGLHRVGTSKACRPILAPATGIPVTPRWGAEPSPRQGKGQSGTDRMHSGDGILAEGTDLIVPGSWASSFSESRGISLAANSEDAQPKRQCDIGRDLVLVQHIMEKATGGSCARQSQSGGSIANILPRYKKGAQEPPKKEASPAFGKVFAASQMVDRAGVRARANSPSRVSVLLEAWEKGLVGMDSTSPSSSADIRRSRSPVHTRRALLSKNASRPLSPATTKSSLSPTDTRQAFPPADTKRFHSLVDTRQSPLPADIIRSFSPVDTRRSHSPADTRCSHSPADTRCSHSPVYTKHSHTPENNGHSHSPVYTRRSHSPADTRRSDSPVYTRRSHSPADTRRSDSPADTRRSHSPADTRRSHSPADTRRSHSPADTRRSHSPAERRWSPLPANTRESFSLADTQQSCSPGNTRCPSSSGSIQHSSSLVQSQYSSSVANGHSSSSPLSMQHSSSLPDIKCQISVADIRRLYSPVDTRRSSSPVGSKRLPSLADTGCLHSSSPADMRHSTSPTTNRHLSSPEDKRSLFSTIDAKLPFPLADTRRSSSPADAKHSSSPASSRSFSPTSDGKRSRSLSPRRDFTAHGPVFSQVYSPSSKPKSLMGTEMQDMNSTVAAESQGEIHDLSATNIALVTGLQKENKVLSRDGPQEESLLPTAVSTRVMESQKKSHTPSETSSSTVPASPKESHMPSVTDLRSQTESYLSRVADTTSFSGSQGGDYTPSAASTKSSGGPSHMVSSSTVVESQTQWYGSQGRNTVVFRSERQVVLPQAGRATVYREGREIIMSNAEVGNKAQPEKASNSAGNISPKESHWQSQDDLANTESPKGSLTSIPDASSSSSTGSWSESCMTQPRSADVSDTQRQRCMLGPSPEFTSKRDATTLREGVVPFSPAQPDCSRNKEAAFQRHDSTVAERGNSMPDPGGPVASKSEQESNQLRAEKISTSGSPKSWHVSEAGGTSGETRVLGSPGGFQQTAPGDQETTTQAEPREEQSNSTKATQGFAWEATCPLAETRCSYEPPSQKTGSSNEMAEEEPEEAMDMELFVDTLRNMEPPELRKPLKLPPRLPHLYTLAKPAPLPPIHEHLITPKSRTPLPEALGELFALTEEMNLEEEKEHKEEDREPVEEEEEIENPYPNPGENNQATTSYPWENKPYKMEEEIGSFLGKLQEHPAQHKSKAIVPNATANQNNFIRANVFRGLSLLSGFADRKAPEDKPYSRLDNSLLYSKFISSEKSLLKTQGKGKEGRCSPSLLVPAALKVNKECQRSPHGLPAETYEELSSKLSLSVLQAENSSRVPGAEGGSSQVPHQSREAVSLSQSSSIPEAQHEEKRFPKINVRPGKIILYSESGFGGQKRDIWGDITDATSWELSHTISIRVVRGGWVMYEKPRFHGRKCVLAEGDVEITNPWKIYHKEGAAAENTPFHIGSLKRVVRDYRTPEITLFTEENGEGTKRRFTDSAEDTRTHSQPLKAASIIVHSGLWLVYSKPFFDDDPYVLEPGGYPSLQAWGAKDPAICSMHPIKLGCPVVEKPGEPKALIYEKPNFQGHSWEVSRDIYDLKKPENNQDSKMPTVGSLKIVGGCWVGYEKEGFRGHQYLLEEGQYHDWTQWGGYNEQLVSLRLIRTDFLDPALVLFEAMDFEDGLSVEFTEALPDVELANYGTTTQSIHVLSGVWVAYEDKNFTGEQYILEKGVYRNCEDWGASNCRISSVQPILQVGEHSLHFISKIQLFSESEFLGDQISFTEDQASLPDNFIPGSCRVHGGSWILYDGPRYDGDQHVLSEGEYPTLTSMGCLFTTAIHSLKKVPIFFSEPSIFLHGLECFEGKEIELNSEVRSLQAEGFNNHVLSVRVKGGIWVLCEHSDFRGHQWLLDCMEITNWLTYSGLQHIGSLYPIKQRRIYFQIKNQELKSFLSVPDDAEDMKAGRVLVSELNDKISSNWYYEEGLMKNQVAPNMSLQVIGPAGKGAKVVLWSESRVPRQTWRVDSFGRICSQMFEDKVLDVKGGRTYDRDHAILWDSTEERPTQIWDIQVL